MDFRAMEQTITCFIPLSAKENKDGETKWEELNYAKLKAAQACSGLHIQYM